MKYSDDEYRNETLRVLAACDWASGLKLAREEGIAEGRTKVKIKLAQNALMEGLDNRVVAKITDLDEAEIERIRTELLN
jgi:predicted transposase/invertase (TIGR01784 family)